MTRLRDLFWMTLKINCAPSCGSGAREFVMPDFRSEKTYVVPVSTCVEGVNCVNCFYFMQRRKKRRPCWRAPGSLNWTSPRFVLSGQSRMWILVDGSPATWQAISRSDKHFNHQKDHFPDDDWERCKIYGRWIYLEFGEAATLLIQCVRDWEKVIDKNLHHGFSHCGLHNFRPHNAGLPRHWGVLRCGRTKPNQRGIPHGKQRVSPVCCSKLFTRFVYFEMNIRCKQWEGVDGFWPNLGEFIPTCRTTMCHHDLWIGLLVLTQFMGVRQTHWPVELWMCAAVFCWLCRAFSQCFGQEWNTPSWHNVLRLESFGFKAKASLKFTGNCSKCTEEMPWASAWSAAGITSSMPENMTSRCATLEAEFQRWHLQFWTKSMLYWKRITPCVSGWFPEGLAYLWGQFMTSSGTNWSSRRGPQSGSPICWMTTKRQTDCALPGKPSGDFCVLQHCRTELWQGMNPGSPVTSQKPTWAHAPGCPKTNHAHPNVWKIDTSTRWCWSLFGMPKESSCMNLCPTDGELMENFIWEWCRDSDSISEGNDHSFGGDRISGCTMMGPQCTGMMTSWAFSSRQTPSSCPTPLIPLIWPPLTSSCLPEWRRTWGGKSSQIWMPWRGVLTMKSDRLASGNSLTHSMKVGTKDCKAVSMHKAVILRSDCHITKDLSTNFWLCFEQKSSHKQVLNLLCSAHTRSRPSTNFGIVTDKI